ncbi:MAG TPA: hypothetical protein VNA28_04000 [Solirubrobacteraceae bacterium]|nr:hypothetical protein [Solirubrobacteraceae bacterium]
MSVRRRIAEHFVVPAAERTAPGGSAASAERRRRRADAAPAGAPPTRACAVSPPRVPACVALLAPPDDAPALAAGLGLALARRERASAAVVCVWAAQSGRQQWHAPALPAAARLAASLGARGHVARGSGRLVIVSLATACEDAAAEAPRVLAAAGAAPTVLALAGPRAAAFDELLAAQDLVVVAVSPGSDPALARLAVAGLARSVACEVPPAHPGRSLAAAGVLLLPSARRTLSRPIEALS